MTVKVLDVTSIPSTIGAATEVWLAQKVQQELMEPLLWEPTGEHVRNPEQLSVLISSLAVDEFGVLIWVDQSRSMWTQTMRVDSKLWIVEASDGSADGYVKRVFRGAPGDYPPRADHEDELHEYEMFTPYAAAYAMWSWQHGTLAEGLSRTLNYLPPTDRHRLGFQD